MTFILLIYKTFNMSAFSHLTRSPPAYDAINNPYDVIDLCDSEAYDSDFVDVNDGFITQVEEPSTDYSRTPGAEYPALPCSRCATQACGFYTPCNLCFRPICSDCEFKYINHLDQLVCEKCEGTKTEEIFMIRKHPQTNIMEFQVRTYGAKLQSTSRKPVDEVLLNDPELFYAFVSHANYK